MIQFNLLPDIKLAYIKARRLKRIVILLSSLVAGTSITVLVILFLVVNGVQKRHLGNLSRDIAADTASLQGVEGINEVLTIQNQLSSLPTLHNAKPVASRLFGFISQTTPNELTMSKFDIDFTESNVIVTGEADTLDLVNQFVDTLKFTTYKISADDDQKTPAFSEVVLKNFGRNDKGASYEVTFKFDPAIFDSTNKVELNVPKIITTRSEIDKPGNLFKKPAPTEETKATDSQPFTEGL